MWKKTARRTRYKGQNIAEAMFTLPFMVVLIFFMSEVGRAWWTYEAVKMAVMDGVHTAAVNQNAGAGTAQAQRRLADAGLAGTASVSQVGGKAAYQGQASVQFQPVFSGDITAFGASMQTGIPAFTISYNNTVKEASLY